MERLLKVENRFNQQQPKKPREPELLGTTQKTGHWFCLEFASLPSGEGWSAPRTSANSVPDGSGSPAARPSAAPARPGGPHPPRRNRKKQTHWVHQSSATFHVHSFQGSFLENPRKTQGSGWCLTRRMVEKNGWNQTLDSVPPRVVFNLNLRPSLGAAKNCMIFRHIAIKFRQISSPKNEHRSCGGVPGKQC